MLSEHKDTILENFLSSAIRTLNTDEIYNILIDSLILLLNPQGLLLTQNLNTRRSFYTVRRWGDIFFEKDYSVPSDAFLEEILHQKVFLVTGSDFLTDNPLLTPGRAAGSHSKIFTQSRRSVISRLSLVFCILLTMRTAFTPKRNLSVSTVSVTMLRIFCATPTCIIMLTMLRSQTVLLPYITENMPLNVSKMPVRRIPRSV